MPRSRASFLLLAARLALFAMLVAALMPTLNRLLSSGGGMGVEVCTGAGVEYVMLDPDPSDERDDRGAPLSTGEHCPYCLVNGGDPVLARSDAAALRVPVAAAPMPPAFFHAPRTLFAWSAARPRAPPFLV